MFEHYNTLRFDGSVVDFDFNYPQLGDSSKGSLFKEISQDSQADHSLEKSPGTLGSLYPNKGLEINDPRVSRARSAGSARSAELLPSQADSYLPGAP